jgi:hypothetical protein
MDAADLEKHVCEAASAPDARHFDCPFCTRSFAVQIALETHLCNGWSV